MAGFFLYRGDYHAFADGDTLPRGAVEVPRLPEIGETWDKKRSAFVIDHAIAADMAVATGHVSMAHALKMAEAATVASGIVLTHGLLAEEAAAFGMPIEQLALSVLAKSAPFRAAEAERRKIKTKGAGA